MERRLLRIGFALVLGTSPGHAANEERRIFGPAAARAAERLFILVGALVALAAPPDAFAAEWDFKTPGEAAYCRLEFTRNTFDAFRCITPNDGFWVRFTGLAAGTKVKVTKGYAANYRGYRDPAVRVLGFGKVFHSSDAAVVTCWSRANGLTCTHYGGLSFWLGRYRGYRIYYDAPGFRPHVRPLFQTGHGVRCGINLDTLEPANPVLLCWRPADGLQLAIAHDNAGQGATHARREKARGYRPGGFPQLSYGRTFSWRCRSVDSNYAERCSPSAGTPVFTCSNDRSRLTCQNRNGRGFWVSARSFYTF